MGWWIIGTMIGVYVVRLFWRAYNHPAHTLGRQAANMNWVATGRVQDSAGFKDVRIARQGLEALISFKNANVVLISPSHPIPFKDFVELERWLATRRKTQPETDEISYYEAIEKYIADMGFYQSVLELQGTDKEFCIASMKMHKAAYLSGQSEKVVGALTIDSANQYRKNRNLALLFLESVEQQYLNKSNRLVNGN